MLFSLCWVLLLSVLGPRAAENLGTKVVSRHTFGPGPGEHAEETLYLAGDRRRTELRPVQRRDDDGSLETVNEFSTVSIVRCDLGEIFTLNPQREEYSSMAYPPKPLTPEEAAARGTTASPDRPTLRIETTTLDTGERKELFGYLARHVITRRKQIPLQGSSSEPQESVIDGWYIDFGPRLSCDPKSSEQAWPYFFPNPPYWPGIAVRPTERPEFVDMNARERGFPLKEVRTSPRKIILADGTRQTSDGSDESAVTVLEQATLDPSLFEVPSGYKNAERDQSNSTE
jgi:hypothetical protein